MENILAFIDLLGFSSMVNKDEDEARNILNDFYNISFSEIKTKPVITGHLFSDSLLVYSTSKPTLINCVATIYQKCLRKNSDYNDLSNFFLSPRGAMSVGIVNIVERETAPNLTKDFIISPALVHSAKLETLIKGSRLLMAIKNEQPQQMELDWNKAIRYPLYEDEAFNFLDNYRYKDVLWYSSFDDDQSRADLEELIGIAISLVQANSVDETTFLQHLWTLRIGLLSYSRYIESESDPIIARIIKEFTEDKFWLIWMTMIEMMYSNNDNWRFAGNEKINDWYKRTSLKLGWSKLIEEINKPGEQYALGCFELFLNEMQQ